MFTPPLPGLTADVLAAIAHLVWRALHDDLGVLMTPTGERQVFFVCGAGAGVVRWGLGGMESAAGLAPHYVTKETAELLQRGRLVGETIEYTGKQYCLQSWFDGVRAVAKPVPIAAEAI